MKPEARRNPAAPYSASVSPPLLSVSSFASAFPRHQRIPGHLTPVHLHRSTPSLPEESRCPEPRCSALDPELHPCAAAAASRRGEVPAIQNSHARAWPWLHTRAPKTQHPDPSPLATQREHAGRLCCGEPPPPRARSSPHPAALCNLLQWITYATGVLPDQTPARFTPVTPSSKNSGRSPLRSKVAGEPRRCPARPVDSSHPIQRPRSRLDRVPVWSEPPDPDPTDQICRYPFGLTILLKSP